MSNFFKYLENKVWLVFGSNDLLGVVKELNEFTYHFHRKPDILLFTQKQIWTLFKQMKEINYDPDSELNRFCEIRFTIIPDEFLLNKDRYETKIIPFASMSRI